MFDISIIFYTLLLRKQIEFSMFKSRRQKKPYSESAWETKSWCGILALIEKF